MGFLDNLLQKKSQPDTPTITPAQNTAKKILVVEDDAYLRDFYVELLRGEGYEIFTAENGQAGYDTVVFQKPNLVLTDLMMPIMDGKQMLHKIRQLPEFKDLPVIILTNAGSADNIKETRLYDNANDFLIKANVQPEEIVKKIKLLLG